MINLFIRINIVIQDKEEEIEDNEQVIDSRAHLYLNLLYDKKSK